MKHAGAVQYHFEQGYRFYDSIIPVLVPGYTLLQQSVIDSIPFSRHEEFNVLDIGCGTGTTILRILKKYPNSRVVGLGTSEAMIARAKQRLRSYGSRTKLIREDIFCLSRADIQPDLIVSVLMIHHFVHKSNIFNKIYSLLGKNQAFIFSDLVVDARKNIRMRRFRMEHMKARGLTEREIHDWFQVFDSEDRPSSIERNTKMLFHAGFRKIQLAWRNENYATIVAKK